MAAIVKDAGDDPDVTHGATIRATVRHGAPGHRRHLPRRPRGRHRHQARPAAARRRAGDQPRAPPADPRRSIAEAGGTDVVVEISVDDGEELARHTWNPRLGILGGLSILGTTGVVVPYSCSAWIDSIRRGIDVARAAGHRHVAACTGSTSEKAVAELYGLPEDALLDMGDFAGAVLKYLRRHPVPRLTIAGGFAKLSKLADGHLDLHSGRSQVDLASLARRTRDEELAESITKANTALDALQLARRPASRSPTPSPRPPEKQRRASSAARRSRWTSWSSTGRGSRSVTRRRVQVAVRELRRREHRAHDDHRGPAHPGLVHLRGDVASVPRSTTSSGRDAYATTATGQSGP